MSWWDHFADESPRLAELGVTQAWLPPPNKAMKKVGYFMFVILFLDTV